MIFYPSFTERLKTQHHAIEAIFSSVGNNRLLIRPVPEKWNIHDNLAHLTSYQPVFLERIYQILKTDEPAFGRYSAPGDPDFETARMLNVDQLITQLNSDREKIYELITGLQNYQVSRVGIHKKFGRLTILQWTEFFLLHEAHHIFTIFQLAHDVEL